MAPPRRPTVRALYIVYDADGTRTGEAMYMLRKFLGIAHCAACDITHGPRVEKPEFTELKTAGWNVPVRNIHRDEMSAPLAHSVGASLPVVAAEIDDGGFVVLLGPRQLDDCEGRVPVLERSVNAALAGAGLHVPSFPPFPPVRRRPAADATMEAEAGGAVDVGDDAMCSDDSHEDDAMPNVNHDVDMRVTSADNEERWREGAHAGREVDGSHHEVYRDAAYGGLRKAESIREQRHMSWDRDSEEDAVVPEWTR